MVVTGQNEASVTVGVKFIAPVISKVLLIRLG